MINVNITFFLRNADQLDVAAYGGGADLTGIDGIGKDSADDAPYIPREVPRLSVSRGGDGGGGGSTPDEPGGGSGGGGSDSGDREDPLALAGYASGGSGGGSDSGGDDDPPMPSAMSKGTGSLDSSARPATLDIRVEIQEKKADM